MESLYGQSGRVHAWLHETGKIYSLSGRNLAFVDDDSVYDWHGAHIAGGRMAMCGIVTEQSHSLLWMLNPSEWLVPPAQLTPQHQLVS